MSEEKKEEQAQTDESQFVQVEVKFLEQLLDYLDTKPHGEVRYFIDVITGHNNKNDR